jgi:hypothetical protein
MQNKLISKECNSKEKNEFQKNVIRIIDLVPSKFQDSNTRMPTLGFFKAPVKLFVKSQFIFFFTFNLFIS